MNAWVSIIANLVIGTLLIGGGLRLLKEYKRAAFYDPESVLTLEVMMSILKRGGGPGVLAFTVILIGAMLAATGIYTILLIIYFDYVKPIL